MACDAIAQLRESNDKSMLIHHRIATLEHMPLAVMALFLAGDIRRQPTPSYDSITQRGMGFSWGMLLLAGYGAIAPSANAERDLQEHLGENPERMTRISTAITAGKGIKDPMELASFFANVMSKCISCARLQLQTKQHLTSPPLLSSPPPSKSSSRRSPRR